MEIRTRSIRKNILKVVCSADGCEVRQGDQILEQADRYQTEECLIQAAVQGQAVSFAQEDRVFARQAACVLEPKEVFRYTFTGNAPVIVTKKTIDGERSFVENADTVKVADAYEGKITFLLDGDEAVYGLGQQENGYFNYRDVK